jgi:hypothetical protein
MGEVLNYQIQEMPNGRPKSERASVPGTVYLILGVPGTGSSGSSGDSLLQFRGQFT